MEVSQLGSAQPMYTSYGVVQGEISPPPKTRLKNAIPSFRLCPRKLRSRKAGNMATNLMFVLANRYPSSDRELGVSTSQTNPVDNDTDVRPNDREPTREASDCAQEITKKNGDAICLYYEPDECPF